MEDTKEGRLFLRKGEWIIDAEPQVMILFEKLFAGSQCRNYYYVSEYIRENIDIPEFVYTHRPRFLKDSISARKDINWFVKRFDLEISEQDRKILEDGSIEYDYIRSEGKKAYNDYKNVSFDVSIPLRDYQLQACSLALKNKSLLVADQIGLGKTAIGIAVGSKNLPALCVVPPHLSHQWIEEINKFIPQASVAKIIGRTPYDPPESDYYIISYHLLQYWVEFFTKTKPVRSLIFDEIHYLRHTNTMRYSSAAMIAEKAGACIGLSATPIINYGDEIFNICDVLKVGCLGDRDSFIREWCVDGNKVRDPELFGNFLKKNMLMVRRTREQVGMKIDSVNKTIYTVNADMEELKKIDNDMQVLAMKAITGVFHESGQSALEFDMKLRQATGIAKAKAVAEIVKTIVDSGEKVVLFGWHRLVYDTWLQELAALNPVMYTGSETAAQKEASLKEFIEGNSKVFIISLRSGLGLNGLQLASSYAVFGELDWSPAIMNQCIGRLWRDGQRHQVNAIFVLIEDGCDPFMKSIIGVKTEQSSKILSPEAEGLSAAVQDEHLKELAKSFLKSKGIDVDNITAKRDIELKGELFIDESVQDADTKRIYSLLKNRMRFFDDETELQNHVEQILASNGISHKREFVISKESRVDFNVDDVLIECKVKGFSKNAMLRQIRRYKYSYPSTRSMIVLSPEKFNHFRIDDVPVFFINISDSSLLMDGLT